jgi:signal transduction histidine kinase
MKMFDLCSDIAFTRNKNFLKFFLIVFPVVLFALADLVIFTMMSRNWINVPERTAIFIVFSLTIIAAVVILYLFDKLIRSLHDARKALNNYIEYRELPHLPVHYTDEAGLLLRDIQSTIIQLDKLLSEKSDMIDLLSHDLRSPLARVISLSNLIKVEPEAEKHIYADYIIDECKNLVRILENILLMLKEDTTTFKTSNANLKKLLLETVNSFDFAINEKKLQLNISLDESININVHQGLFTQALRNILSNAIKFSPDNKSISINVKEDREKIAVIIQDEGIGFASADIQKLFDRFTHAGRKGTHGEASTGLGLYLSKKIVEKHGGKLIAESKGLNKGATFTILLYQVALTKLPAISVAKVEQQGELFKR